MDSLETIVQPLAEYGLIFLLLHAYEVNSGNTENVIHFL